MANDAFKELMKKTDSLKKKKDAPSDIEIEDINKNIEIEIPVKEVEKPDEILELKKEENIPITEVEIISDNIEKDANINVTNLLDLSYRETNNLNKEKPQKKEFKEKLTNEDANLLVETIKNYKASTNNSSRRILIFALFHF